MRLEVVSFFIILTEIISVCGHQGKFVIENKKTGNVIEEVGSSLKALEWDNTDRQLWTLETKDNGYKIDNVASGAYIQCTFNNSSYTAWKLSIEGDTRIETDPSKMFLCEDETVLRCCTSKGDDEGDVWKFIEQSKKIGMTFTIENKETEEVLEERGIILEMGQWKNRNSQLWRLKPHNKSGYSIVNVASGEILTYSENGTEYDIWKLKNRGDTQIQIEHPDVFLAHKNSKPVYIAYKQKDDSDKWSLIEREYENADTKSKRIYVEAHQKRFSIENKKSGEVLEEVNTALKMGKWENKDSQLWILKSQNNSRYSIVNVASGRVLAYSKSDIVQEIWKLNNHGDTLIHDENTNVVLALKNGKPVFSTDKQNDDSEKWLFVERESTRRIFVENYKERFVIENKKTGMVMENTGGKHNIMEWSNKDAQLWTLELQNNSGYLLNNVATKNYITCTIGGSDYYVWKLNAQNETRIEIEDPTIILFPSLDDNNKIKCSHSKRDDNSDIWILIEQFKKINMKFVIENKKTGKILEAVDGRLTMGNWENRDSQLWTLKLQNESEYSIVNVADGKVLTYSKNGIDNEVLKLNSHGDTRIQVAHLNVFLANKNDKPIFLEHKQNDESDKWLFVQRESVGSNTQPKRIYVENYQEKFVIENKKTRKVLGISQRYLVLEEWEDKDLQLWTLEPQNKSGYFTIRNIEDRGILTYNENGTDCQIWKVNDQGETWIQLEDTNIFLADKGGALTFVENKQGDDSDIWLLVDQASKRANMKPKPIYIEAQLLKDIVF